LSATPPPPLPFRYNRLAPFSRHCPAPLVEVTFLLRLTSSLAGWSCLSTSRPLLLFSESCGSLVRGQQHAPPNSLARPDISAHGTHRAWFFDQVTRSLQVRNPEHADFEISSHNLPSCQRRRSMPLDSKLLCFSVDEINDLPPRPRPSAPPHTIAIGHRSRTFFADAILFSPSPPVDSPPPLSIFGSRDCIFSSLFLSVCWLFVFRLLFL